MSFVNVGLILDVVGVILVWKFGLPANLSREGHSYVLLEQEDDAQRKKAAKYDFWSRVGLALIVLGFVLQIAGNLLAADA